MIVTVVVLILCIGFCVFVYIGVTKQGAKQDELFDSIREKAKQIIEIDKVEFAELKAVIDNIESNYIKLECIRRIFKYSLHEEYWIEYNILNTTEEDLSFEINYAEIIQNGNKLLCDKTLLFEKVPEHIAPPYGNAYFDTSLGVNFSLGLNAPSNFIFTSRFTLNDHKLKETDYITIEVKINRVDLDTKSQVVVETVILKNYLKNLTFKSIQSIEGEIHWEENHY